MTGLAGITSLRILATAGLAVAYFTTLYSLIALGPSVIFALLAPGTTDWSMVPTVVVFGLVSLTAELGVAAIAALVIGFPLALVARRLLGPTHSVWLIVGAAFVVGAVSGVLASIPIGQMLGGFTSGGGLHWCLGIAVAAGLSAAAAWWTTWCASPIRAATAVL